jgi:transcriptional regulator with XRE-family HTH domain
VYQHILLVTMAAELIYQRIGAIIRNRRRGVDWSQAELAQRLDISRATLASVETGRQRLLVHQLYALARVFGVKPEQLLPPAPESSPVSREMRAQLPANLSNEQAKQIATLIGTVETLPSNSAAEKNAKSLKRVGRAAR